MHSEVAGCVPGFGNCVQAGGSDSALAAVFFGCLHLLQLPGGSAVPLAFAARAGHLLKRQERSLNSAAPCCSVAPAITEQAWGDGHPSPTDLPTFTLVFCVDLSYRAGPAMLLGPSILLQVLLEMPIVIFLLCEVIKPTD